MSTTSSFVAASTPALLHRSFSFSSRCLRSSLPTGPQFRFKAWSLRVKCKFSEPNQDAESEAETTESSLSSTNSSSSSSSSAISAFDWCAGLGGLGFIETAYLTYLKLTDTEAFCPTTGGGSCGDVLNSDYAAIFGVPLSLIGMVAYGLVSALSLQLSGRKLPFGVSESDGRLILLTSTTSMAAASGYFLYILNTRFSGLSCSYCLLSAFLSFSLFFITLKVLFLHFPYSLCVYCL
uniref:Vitamin K epoxide reductase domain-containing protein n=1 Tax=Rhizophora mucronata TaxID=61149 RepID=A0A2P2JMI8_RHIMU